MSRVLLREHYPLCPDNSCRMELLNEQEKEDMKKGWMYLTGVIQRAEVKNANNRIYSKKVLDEAMQAYDLLVRQSRAFGECDHRDDETVELKQASHRLIRWWWEGNDMLGVLKVMNTPNGKILQEIVNSGGQLSVSSRALGNLTEDRNSGANLVDSLEFVAYDCVSNPSVNEAFMTPRMIKESTSSNNQLFNKAYRLNRLLNDITRK